VINQLKFLKNGYYKFKIDKKTFNSCLKILNEKIKKNYKSFNKTSIDDIHKILETDQLNNFRMKIFKDLNSSQKFKTLVFSSSKEYIESAVGSELCCSDLNLSIQLPNDKKSLLEMHTDFFSGESLFQVNLWMPFVPVKKTQSMFIMSPKKSIEALKLIKNDKKINFNTIQKKFNKDIKWINFKLGEAMLFSPNCLHGNVMNKENKTRWSINIRYKNIFSPYTNFANEKRIGSFYNLHSPKIITKFNAMYDFKTILDD
tara:strand:- start:7385 stop:8158 length:774 start_codon:yes stop_codon:yes gene_type:complete